MSAKGGFDPDWRIADDSADFITKWFAERNPKVTVEFGSGYSTVLMAGLVDAWEGVVIAFEQDENFANKTRSVLEESNIVAGAVMHAPIVDGWYSGVEVPPNIDFVLVDGPGPCKDRTRAPALAAVYDHLAPKALVVVDDGNRDSVVEDVYGWRDEFPGLQVCFVPNDRGMFLAWKSS